MGTRDPGPEFGTLTLDASPRVDRMERAHGALLAIDPDVVGGQFARAVAAIVCRCVHPTAAVRPCEVCGRGLDPPTTHRLGRALFIGAGVPLGLRGVRAKEYEEVGWLLEQVERLAAGQPPQRR